MQKLKPAEAIEALGIIASLPWRELTRSDHAAFADAGPDARIAEMGREDSVRFARLFDSEIHADCPLLAIIGGDSLQLEIHGVQPSGEPIGISYDLHASEQ